MDSSKLKQKSINAFFGGSAKKDDGPKPTQQKISAFFGGASKAAGTPKAVAAAKTPGAPAATPPPGSAAAAPAAGVAGPATTPAGAPPPSAAAPAAAAPASAAPPTATAKAAKVPAGGSTSKPKPANNAAAVSTPAANGNKANKASSAKGDASGKAATKKDASKGGKAAKKAPGKAAGGGLKRLRRTIIEDEEGADAVADGLEDDVGDNEEEEEEQTDGDSEYEAGASGGSDEDFSAEEEEDDDEEEEEEASESDGDDNVGVGGKRKRPPTKSSAPAKRALGSSAKTKTQTRTAAAATTPAGRAAASAANAASAAAHTPGGARTPLAAAHTPGAAAVTPHHGTASKGPASATAAGGGGRSVVSTPGTVAPPGQAGGGYGSSAGRSRGGGGGGGGGGAVTPSSVRSLSSALGDTPSKSQATSEVTLGVAACTDGEAARFQERMSSRFPFLQPEQLRDAQQRRPDHPEYDPATLYIPPSWFKEYKISEGQQQWWNFKSRHFDAVLLFKMGKFYEMFEMDAYVGVEVLGLTFMRGEQPHAGFPEVKYADMAERLARAGYRVVVIEQTETPEMLAKRNEERKMRGLKMCNVVDRQKVAVLSRGTLVDAEMVASRPDASYVLAVAEVDVEQQQQQQEEAPSGGGGGGGRVRIGLCAVDAASGQVLVGEFDDDEVRSTLRTQLTALQPQELVLPRKPLSATTSHVLRNGTRDPRVNVLRGLAGEWSAEKTYRFLRDRNYFTASAAAAAEASNGAYGTDPWVTAGADAMDVDTSAADAGAAAGPEVDASLRWPALLRRLVAGGVESHPAAMAALGGAIAFLRDCLLDLAVIPLGRFEELPALQPAAAAGGAAAGEAGGAADPRHAGPLYMSLNGAALENLEILENGDGGSAGTLLSVLDHCTTPFGRRRLRQWLCRPLGRIADIQARQAAVAALMGGRLGEAAGQARKMLAGVSDLERALTRLHASTVDGACGRDAAHVVLYEDAGRRRVAALWGALRDLRA
ncbi:hypothetical protein Agub_g7598, partial [Astrephomene gubernaculifera]